MLKKQKIGKFLAEMRKRKRLKKMGEIVWLEASKRKAREHGAGKKTQQKQEPRKFYAFCVHCCCDTELCVKRVCVASRVILQRWGVESEKETYTRMTLENTVSYVPRQ